MLSAAQFVYVTGTDSGFGEIVTKMLDKKGFGVFPGCYLEASMERLKKECSERVVPLQLDVTKDASVEAAAKRIVEELGKRPGSKLVGVVNNAGILVTPGPVEFTPLSSFESMMQVNYLGTVRVTKSVLSLIRKSQGRIVNVASIAGRVGLPSQPAYCPSKYAVEAFSDVLRKDMLPWGVSVHIIEPGVFNKTGLYNDYQTGLDRLWDKCPEAIKTEYGQAYKDWFRNLLGLALNDFGNHNSNLVPEAMVDALTSKNPKYRYRVGNDSKFMITPLTWMHESMQDTLLTLTDSRCPEVLPATAPRNGRAILAKRYQGPNYKLFIALLVALFIYRRTR